MNDKDLELLTRYSRQHAEDAFAELVRRHLGLVYSAALRQVRSPQLAEEVAQSTFSDLARQAQTLQPGTVLTAWLYQVTRRTAIDVVRREASRQLREQIATEMNTIIASGTEWNDIEPLLEEAMESLEDIDRTAVLLRYFENKSLREVGAALGASENAAQKRLSRAIERLREFFVKRGIPMGASGLVAIISANAVQSAPIGLAATVSASAVLGAIPAVAIPAATTIKTITMTALQKTLVTATVAVLAGAAIHQGLRAHALRERVQTLEQAQTPLKDELAKLEAENKQLSERAVRTSSSQGPSAAQTDDLLKLRRSAAAAQANAREVARLNSMLNEQPAKTPSFLTNAMSIGIEAAQKISLKGAQAKLARMKSALGLSDEQAQAITHIMQQHIKKQTDTFMQGFSPKPPTESPAPAAGQVLSQEDEIKALLTPEQLAAYSEFKQSERSATANKSAGEDAEQIAGAFKLPGEQQEKIRSAIYEAILQDSATESTEEAIAAAKSSGNMAEAARLRIDSLRTQLEQKLQALGNLLTPEQISSYREAETRKIDMIVQASKFLIPQNK